MNLSQIPKNLTVIIDTNIFVYAAQKKSAQCVNLLERCLYGEIYGIIPIHILAELVHVLMIAEAKGNGIITGSNPTKQLSENPEKIKTLGKYEELTKDILSIGLQPEPLIREDFMIAFGLQRKYGLLTNDALLLAMAERLRVLSIASGDMIFKRVDGMQVYLPDDLI